MNDSRAVLKGKEDDTVVVGTVTKAHGLRGEIKVKPTGPDATNLRHVQRLWVGRNGYEGEWLLVEQTARFGSDVLVKLKGVDSRDRAESMRGSVLKIPKQECRALPPDSYYTFDLVGLNVETRDGRSIGTVRDVLNLPAQTVLVIETSGGEILIPAVKQFVKSIDMASHTILIEPIEGMLDGHDH